MASLTYKARMEYYYWLLKLQATKPHVYQQVVRKPLDEAASYRHISEFSGES